MNADHRKPALAFVVLVILAIAVIGTQMRADAHLEQVVVAGPAAANIATKVRLQAAPTADAATRQLRRQADRVARSVSERVDRSASRSAEPRNPLPGSRGRDASRDGTADAVARVIRLLDRKHGPTVRRTVRSLGVSRAVVHRVRGYVARRR